MAAVIQPLTISRISLAVEDWTCALVLTRFDGVAFGGIAALSRRRFCAFALTLAICAASFGGKVVPGIQFDDVKLFVCEQRAE